MEITAAGIVNDTKFDRECMQTCIELAQGSRAEDDRPHPLVGAVVAKTGIVLAKATRGAPGHGEHAEFLAMRSLKPEQLEGSTVYTTLEPCSRRGPDKIHARDAFPKQALPGSLSECLTQIR